MELKINSLLQRAAVVAQPRATAIVPGLSPERNWIRVEVEGGHHPASGGTWAPWAVAATSLGTSPPWHRSPLTVCPGCRIRLGQLRRGSSHPPPGSAEPLPVLCPTSCPALAATGKASPEIF